MGTYIVERPDIGLEIVTPETDVLYPFDLECGTYALVMGNPERATVTLAIKGSPKDLQEFVMRVAKLVWNQIPEEAPGGRDHPPT
ncbi:hypothetical protein ABZX85_47635 [Streptomyces sp. NPDC004539]|uniref:hypothetical protein n=1 Tax=Streptomyces sp. NPDC004539 TaxID=3154280 RepID=UPI0033B8A253